MKPASPQILALAEIGGLLLDAALAGLLVFALVDRIAPPQDLPWKPFSIDQPLGLATAGKLSRIGADPAACRAALRAGGIDPVDQPVRDQGFCSTRDTVRAPSLLSPAAPVMTCPLALRYAVWERQLLAPAAERILGGRLVGVDHFGSYACRTIYGRPGERPSQHARAAALDVSGVRLADGRRLTLAADFRKAGPEGRFLRTARAGACEVFGAVLSPDYNAAQRRSPAPGPQRLPPLPLSATIERAPPEIGARGCDAADVRAIVGRVPDAFPRKPADAPLHPGDRR